MATVYVNGKRQAQQELAKLLTELGVRPKRGGTRAKTVADACTAWLTVFDALVAASTTAKNYGESGFMAKTRAEELPAKGYNVTITQDLKDVTSDILNGITDTMSPVERNRAISTKIQAMESAGENEAEGISVRVLAMNEGMSYYKFTYLVLPDVRIVYAPPKNIDK